MEAASVRLLSPNESQQPPANMFELMRATHAERGDERWRRNRGRRERVFRWSNPSDARVNRVTIAEMHPTTLFRPTKERPIRADASRASGEMASVFVADVPCFCAGGPRRSACNGRAISRSLFNDHLRSDRAAWAALTPAQRASPAWSHLSCAHEVNGRRRAQMAGKVASPSTAHGVCPLSLQPDICSTWVARALRARRTKGGQPAPAPRPALAADPIASSSAHRVELGPQDARPRSRS